MTKHKPSEEEQDVLDGEVTSSSETVTLHGEELTEIKKERDQLMTLVQRVQADSMNYRKRMQDEREEQKQQTNAVLLQKFLPIVDEFAMALEHLSTKDNAWTDGVRLIYRKLIMLLDTEGVEKIDTLGQMFDPWQHEAILYRETADSEEGTVISTVREGYTLHKRILRPAQVVVAQHLPDTDEAQPSVEAMSTPDSSEE